MERPTQNKESKTIAGKEYLSRRAAAKFIGMATSTLDKLLARQRHGRLSVFLECYQPGGKGSPAWFKKEALEKWVEDVAKAGGLGVVSKPIPKSSLFPQTMVSGNRNKIIER